MKENNILLAEFLGLEVMERSTEGWRECRFNFHNSWDSLMLVVEKIESLDLGTKIIETIYDDEDEYINASVSFRIEYKDCYIDLYGDMKIYENWIVCKECSSKIEATYSACVEFIKWYNESKGEN